MGQRRYIDFDAIMKENERKPIIGKIKGEEFLFPAQMPAKMMLRIQRMEEQGVDGEQEMTSNMILDLFGSMLGEKNFQRLLDLNASFEELQFILEGIMKEYMGDAIEETPKKAAAAEVVEMKQTAEKETEYRL